VRAPDHAVSRRNLRRFLLQRNIKIGTLVTFSRACRSGYNGRPGLLVWGLTA
jgi:hypothetical protein